MGKAYFLFTMYRITFFFICTFSFINYVGAQKGLNANTILEKVDSVYSTYETLRCVYQNTKYYEGETDTTISNGKLYLSKSEVSPIGLIFHSVNLNSKTTQIFDGKKNTIISHQNQTYQHVDENSTRYMQLHHSAIISLFNPKYLDNFLNKSPGIKSVDLLSDTLIGGIECYQIEVVVQPSIEGYSNFYDYYYFQKDNYFCKARRIKTIDSRKPRWNETIVTYAEINKKIDRDRFNFEKHISPRYELLDISISEEEASLLNDGLSVPKFKGYTLDQKKITHKTLKGKVTVLDFWFIHCAPCIKAFPTLDSLYTRYKDDGVQFIGMNSHDQKDQIKDFKRTKGYSFETLTISNKVADKFKVLFYPTLYIVDQNGRIAYSKRGRSNNLYSELSYEIDKLLAKDE